MSAGYVGVGSYMTFSITTVVGKFCTMTGGSDTCKMNIVSFMMTFVSEMTFISINIIS